MDSPVLPADHLERIRTLFRRHPRITAVRLYGSRAKGCHRPESDVDLALDGEFTALEAQAIAAELDELPLPYHFDVRPYTSIQLPALREHIDRVGIRIYP